MDVLEFLCSFLIKSFVFLTNPGGLPVENVNNFLDEAVDLGKLSYDCKSESRAAILHSLLGLER